MKRRPPEIDNPVLTQQLRWMAPCPRGHNRLCHQGNQQLRAGMPKLTLHRMCQNIQEFTSLIIAWILSPAKTDNTSEHTGALASLLLRIINTVPDVIHSKTCEITPLDNHIDQALHLLYNAGIFGRVQQCTIEISLDYVL